MLLLPGPLKYKFDPAPDSPSLTLFLPQYFTPFYLLLQPLVNLPIITATVAMTACLYLSGSFPLCRKIYTVQHIAPSIYVARGHTYERVAVQPVSPQILPPAERIRLR